MKFAIIGAGLAGLTSAYEIRKAEPDAHIDVYEATDRIGGKLLTIPFEAGPTDMGAEAFLYHRPAAREFFTELGLADKIKFPSGLRSTVFTGGELKNLPRGGMMGIPSSSSPVEHLVSEETAARIDAEADQPGIDWEVGGDMNVGALVRERMGDEVVDRIVSALLGGVYSCTADDLGIRATIPRLAEEFDRLAEAGEKVTFHAAIEAISQQRKEQSAGVKPGPVFGAFDGGYAEVYETLAEKSGANIYIDAFISGAKRTNTGTFTLTGGQDDKYDRLILATPAPTTALLLRDIAPEAGGALKSVQLADSAVVGMRFATDEGLPDNSGVLVAADQEGVHAKAFTFSSKKWPHLGERGGALIRASFGRFGDTIARDTDEDTLVDWALDDLQTTTGFDGRAAGLEEIYVQRWLGGLPRYDENHIATVREVFSLIDDVPGLALTGAWAGGVGVPAVITHAKETVASMLGEK